MVEGICREFKIIHKITHKQLLGLFNLFSFYFFIKPLRLMFFHARLKQVVLSTAACILLFISEVAIELELWHLLNLVIVLIAWLHFLTDLYPRVLIIKTQIFFTQSMHIEAIIEVTTPFSERAWGHRPNMTGLAFDTDNLITVVSARGSFTSVIVLHRVFDLFLSFFRRRTRAWVLFLWFKDHLVVIVIVLRIILCIDRIKTGVRVAKIIQYIYWLNLQWSFAVLCICS